MSRMPIRLRLSLVFALTMAVVLAAIGASLYLGVRETLNEQIAANPATAAEAREDRDETLAALLGFLLVGGPVALALATLAGYRLAGAALRPVESMRQEAAEISAATSERRLPLPEARDEVRRLGETLNEMLERLDEGLRRERRFVADASHELRTPLALLKTELELALRRPRPPEELEGSLRSAAEEVDRLARLAENLLLLERSESDGAPLQHSTFPARTLLETVAGRFAAVDRPFEIDAGVDVISGDRTQLEQALGNLVDNAIRHGSGRVELAARREDDALLLSVADEGAGFPPEFAARAFERFSRADESRSTGGAGLGLAIAAAVARAHGGSASVSGATVTITLPS